MQLSGCVSLISNNWLHRFPNKKLFELNLSISNFAIFGLYIMVYCFVATANWVVNAWFVSVRALALSAWITDNLKSQSNKQNKVKQDYLILYCYGHASSGAQLIRFEKTLILCNYFFIYYYFPSKGFL